MVTLATYVHGYSERECARLTDQADALADLLHEGTAYPPGSAVLEAGCGVGSQTAFLAANSAGAHITAVDISPESLAVARARLDGIGFANVTFRVADIFDLPFDDESFDHVFVCYVLEHLRNPARALAALRRVLRPGGSITVIEGDHGSAFFHPNSAYARLVIQCLVDLQTRAGGDALVGRQLHPLLTTAGFADVRVRPCVVYADRQRPDLVEGFTRRTFTAMIEGVREEAVGQQLTSAAIWDKGVADLYRTAEPDGVFCYTFFKGVGYKRVDEVR